LYSRASPLNKILLCEATGYRLGGEMSENKKKPSRRRIQQVHVPVLPAEMTDIKRNAANCGLSVSAYLRNLGLQYRPKTILDANSVLELVRVNGDLGRLGGLLKMLLTNDEKVKALGKEQVTAKIYSLLEEIEVTQALLFETVKRV
jgi:hypothetical protein